MNRLCVVAIFVLSSTFSFAQTYERPVQPDLPGDLRIDYGFNFWTEEPDILPNKWWGSNSFGVYYTQRFDMGSYFSFYPALGITLDKFAFDDNYTWLREADGTVSLDSMSIGLSKNKIAATYIELPLEFRIHPLKTVNGEGFFIGVGGMVGYRIGSHTKVKYDLGDQTTKEKLYDDFGLANVRYGVQGRLGFKSFHVFGKYYLNDLFSSKPTENANPGLWTIGISVSGF